MIGWLNHWGGLAGPGLFVVAFGVVVGRVWYLRSCRRAEVAETAAPLVGVVRVPQPWHPSQRPMCAEPVTELLPRISDRPDATVFIPRQRAGDRRG